MDFLGFLVTQCLNALSQAALLFFLGVGLTLIFGIMRIVNFAHGAFFMLGAYVGYSAVHLTGSFWAALIAAPLLVGGFGAAFELGILRRLYSRDHSAFLMVTFGLTLIMGEAIRLLWGVAALEVTGAEIVCPASCSFWTNRSRSTACSSSAPASSSRSRIWQFLERTRLGLLIRATSQNAEMVHALGTDVRLVRSAVFGIGCGLAGIGGVFAAPLVTASLGMAPNAVIDTFVIVIIGGMGSFAGSLIGALLVAFVQVFGTYYFPDLAMALMYLVMLTVLVVRPGGLLGKEA